MTDEELIVRLNNLFWILEEEGHYTKANTSRFAAARIGSRAAEIKRLEQACAEWADRSEAQAAEIERLEKACVEWAEVSQSNYQRAKAAEAKLAKAVEALETICYQDVEDESIYTARTTLAELTGAKP